jgi:hypothetical protein
MELKELKIIFDSGALKNAVVTPVPMADGYNVHFMDSKNKVINMTAQRCKKEEPRIFKSIDAAVANIKKVGFKNIQIAL